MGESQAVVVDALRTLVVVVGTGHVALALSLVDDEDDLGRDLCA